MTHTPAGPRRAVSLETGQAVVLKVLSPVAVGAPADAWLRFITAVAGVSHPSLGRVVDGGVEPRRRSGACGGWPSIPSRAATPRCASPRAPQPPVTVVSPRARAGRRAPPPPQPGRGPRRSRARERDPAARRGRRRSSATGARSCVATARARPRAPTRRVPTTSRPSSRRGGTPPDAGVRRVRPRRGHGGAWRRASRRSSAPSTEAAAHGCAPAAGAEPLPAALVDLISRALADEPVGRPTAEDVGQALAYVEATLRPSS